jgi:hypothetical protein
MDEIRTAPPTLANARVVSTAALVVLALSALGIWNEVRYQGCIARIDQRDLINATAKGAALPPIGCHRLPFRH